ncbi:C-type lectin domain family 4 member F-like [Tiliqua scincoides]|uniref:C-type lectin domain family 4 member F-like n=1 Tax=Tiliqua scincoides TaxID=71010 RepID=UPI00346240CA
MERDHSYENVVKLQVDERAPFPSRRSIFISTFLAVLVLLLAVLLVAVAVLYFQKDRKLQELEGVIEKIRTTLQLSNVPFSPGNTSDSFRLSDAYLLENIHQTFAKIQAHLKDMRASRNAAEARYRNLQGMLSSGWKFYNGSFYFFSQEAKPWKDAVAACRSRGAHLTSVSSREEMEYLSKETKEKGVWIGLTDQWREGTWTWMDGTKYSKDVSFWLPGQPDNWTGAPGHQENCVTLTTKWNDVSCTYSYKWICKKPL